MTIITAQEFRRLQDVPNVRESDSTMLFRDNRIKRSSISSVSDAIGDLLFGSNIKLICSDQDWETNAESVTATEITLKDNVAYVVCEPSNLTKTIVLNKSVTIVDLSEGRNKITSTASVAFRSADLGTTAGGLGSIFQSLHIVGDTTNTLFDITSTSSAFFTLRDTIIFDFDNLGTLTGLSIQGSTVGLFDFTTGLSIFGADFFQFLTINAVTTANTTAFSLSGVFTSQVAFGDMNIATGATGNAFDIDSGITAPNIRFNNIAYSGGVFFDPSGLSETDIPIDASDVQDIADSAPIGAMCFINNSNPTVISAQSADGVITAFADAGGGDVTVTSTAHGLSNGNEIVIVDTINYNGTFIIANVTANTFDITVTFVATETGNWEFGWVDIVGAAVAGEIIERFTLQTSPNRLTYIDTPPIKGIISTSLAAINGASGIVHELAVFEDTNTGRGFSRISDSLWQGEFDNRIKSLSFSVSHEIVKNEVFKVMVRNTESIANITLVFFEINIR